MGEPIQAQADYHIATLGQYGIESITATNSSTADNEYVAIMAIGDDAQVDLTLARGGTTTLTNVTIPQNVILPLPITAITVDTGTVWAWLADPFKPAS